jgi:hypothetical protein
MRLPKEDFDPNQNNKNTWETSEVILGCASVKLTYKQKICPKISDNTFTNSHTFQYIQANIVYKNMNQNFTSYEKMNRSNYVHTRESITHSQSISNPEQSVRIHK